MVSWFVGWLIGRGPSTEPSKPPFTTSWPLGCSLAWLDGWLNDFARSAHFGLSCGLSVVTWASKARCQLGRQTAGRTPGKSGYVSSPVSCRTHFKFCKLAGRMPGQATQQPTAEATDLQATNQPQIDNASTGQQTTPPIHRATNHSIQPSFEPMDRSAPQASRNQAVFQA